MTARAGASCLSRRLRGRRKTRASGVVYAWEDFPDFGAVDDDDTGEELAAQLTERLAHHAKAEAEAGEVGEAYEALTDD